MAIKKAGDTPTPTRRPEHGGGSRPTVSTGPLVVTAQGATLKDDDRLIIVVRVTEPDGAPVTGLAEANFRLWQMGHLFDQLSGFFVVEMQDIAGLEGTYQLVRKPWSLVGNGTIPFIVRVEKGRLRSGTAMTFIVKVRDGLDL